MLWSLECPGDRREGSQRAPVRGTSPSHRISQLLRGRRCPAREYCGGRLYPSGLGALLALVVLAASCSTEKKYEVLSFFFDGVPKPGEAPPKDKVSPQFIGNLKPRAPTKLDLVFHKPYQQNKCKECHPPERALSIGEQIPKDICFWCHEHDVFRQYLEGLRYVHGPVAVESCLACHDPHYSRFGALLLEADPKLCYLCHEREMVESSPAHPDVTEWKCLECHDPHGGSNRFFVKAEGERRAGSAARGPPVTEERATGRGQP